MERWHNPQHSFKLQYKTRSYALTWYGNLIEFIGFFESFLHYCSKISFSKWVSYNFILCHKSASENTFLTSRNFNYVVRCNFWTFFLGAYGINFSTDNKAVKCIFCKRCVIFYAVEKLWKREHKVTSKSKITLSQVCVKSHWEERLQAIWITSSSYQPFKAGVHICFYSHRGSSGFFQGTAPEPNPLFVAHTLTSIGCAINHMG